MSFSAFSVFSNVFGFIVAAVSFSAFLVNICRTHLPSHRIKELESLMDSTDAFFKKALEDGLLIEPAFIRQTERHLTMLRTVTCQLQTRAYNATTLRQDYLELFRGTSGYIGDTCRSLKRIRAQVMTSSEEGRRRLTAGDMIPHASLAPLPRNPVHEDRHSVPHRGQGTRPHSCPPVLPGLEPCYAQSVFPLNRLIPSSHAE